MIRILEHKDWVVWVILGVAFVLVFVLQYLQREPSLRRFFFQKYEDTTNIFATWLLVSLCYMILLVALVSQYVPIVPRFVEEIGVQGWSLNKFGFTLVAVLAFYFVKLVFSFMFYVCIGDGKKWGRLSLVSSKFYLGVSLLLIVASFLNYYIISERLLYVKILMMGAFLVYLFKLFFYAFNKNDVFPRQWYYKILYICTLQFAPILALWKLLFY